LQSRPPVFKSGQGPGKRIIEKIDFFGLFYPGGKDFVSGDHLPEARKQFLAMLVLSVMLRNGEGHLKNFGVAHLSLPIKTISDTFNRVAEAVTETRAMIPGYLNDHPEFREIGELMMAEWDEGVRGLVGREYF